MSTPGGATRGKNIEETALKTNLEAAEEISRILRVCNIGGLIVIDFIDMTPLKNQRQIEQQLRDHTQSDRARVQIGKISQFGLLEMSRQRIKSALNRKNRVICPRCNGRGSIRTVESFSSTLLNLLQEHAVKSKETQIQLQLPIDVTTFLINEKNSSLRKIEDTTGVQIILIPNQHMHTPQYHLKTVKLIHDKNTESYKLIKQQHLEQIPEAIKKKEKHQPPPAVEQFLPSKHNNITAPKTKQEPGILKRLVEAVFGKPSNHTQKAKPQKRKSTQKNSKPAKEKRSNNRRGSRAGNNLRATSPTKNTAKNKAKRKPINTTQANKTNKAKTSKNQLRSEKNPKHESENKQAIKSTDNISEIKKKDINNLSKEKVETTQHASVIDKKNINESSLESKTKSTSQRYDASLYIQKKTSNADMRQIKTNKIKQENTIKSNNSEEK